MFQVEPQMVKITPFLHAVIVAVLVNIGRNLRVGGEGGNIQRNTKKIRKAEFLKEKYNFNKY